MNSNIFPIAIIISRPDVEPVGGLVRVFRGVTTFNEVCNQTPYAGRREKENGIPTILEIVRPQVEALAQNPSYENLIAYTNLVRLFLSKKEVERLDRDLLSIENGILNGMSTRKQLVFLQAGHLGSYFGESGISPYISASYDYFVAIGYGRDGGLIVYDLPLNRIQDFSPDINTEVCIKGYLGTEHITAILPRKNYGKENRNYRQELDNAMQEVFQIAPNNIYQNDELQKIRENIKTEQDKWDQMQLKEDVRKVRQKRVFALIQRFPEVNLDLVDTTEEQDFDFYTKAKKDIFDFYIRVYKEVNPQGDFELWEKERSDVNESILLKLKRSFLNYMNKNDRYKRV